MIHLDVTEHRQGMNDNSKDVLLQRLEGAETAARRAVQTIERQVQLATNGGENDVDEMLRTAERELEHALAELRGEGTRQALG